MSNDNSTAALLNALDQGFRDAFARNPVMQRSSYGCPAPASLAEALLCAHLAIDVDHIDWAGIPLADCVAFAGATGHYTDPENDEPQSNHDRINGVGLTQKGRDLAESKGWLIQASFVTTGW